MPSTTSYAAATSPSASTSAVAIHSLLDQFAYTWLAAGGDGTGRTISDEEAIETLTEFVHRGLAGTPPVRRESPPG